MSQACLANSAAAQRIDNDILWAAGAEEALATLWAGMLLCPETAGGPL